MTDQNNALIMGIAQIIDHPSVYMGGPSRNSLRIAETIVKEFGADIASADRAAPEGQVGALLEAEKRGMQKVLSHFRECAEHDQGGLDYSSLVGIPICNADELASEVAFYERAARHVQDVLDRADLASREAPPDSDSGEKPLCPVCYNRTDAELRTIGGFYSMESNCPECSPRAKERAKQDADREALVRLLQIITRNGSLDDGRTLHEVIADALLARGLRPPACQQEAVTERALLQRAVDLIKGDLTGSEWKRACNAFVKDALRTLKGKQ